MTSTRALSVFAVLAFGLTACSSGGSGAPGTGPTASGSPLAAPTAGARCDQLTKAEVQPLLTVPIASVKVTPAGQGGQQCVFAGNDSAGDIDVLVLGGADAATAYQEEVSAYSDGPASVPGVGDKATRDVQDDQINALRGNVYCSVSLGSDEDVPGIGGLEEAAGGTTHIAESAYAAAAAALGTLCNRIYGRGNTTPDLAAITAGASVSAVAAPGASSAAAPNGDVTSKACGAITLGDAQALVVQRISAVQFTPGDSARNAGGTFECGIGGTVRITVEPQDGNSTLYTSHLADENIGKGVPVSGVGDTAAYASAFGAVPDLYAHQGAVTCGVTTNGDTSDVTAKTDPNDPIHAVSAKAAAAYAGLEGKVCSDVFAAIG